MKSLEKTTKILKCIRLNEDKNLKEVACMLGIALSESESEEIEDYLLQKEFIENKENNDEIKLSLKGIEYTSKLFK